MLDEKVSLSLFLSLVHFQKCVTQLRDKIGKGRIKYNALSTSFSLEEALRGAKNPEKGKTIKKMEVELDYYMEREKS